VPLIFNVGVRCELFLVNLKYTSAPVYNTKPGMFAVFAAVPIAVVQSPCNPVGGFNICHYVPSYVIS